MRSRARAVASGTASLHAAVLRALTLPPRGVAAVEMALATPVLLLLLANVYDLGSYAYRSVELKNAAQMGVQAVWQNCDQSKLPATINCSTLNAVVTTAIQSTTLGSGVSLYGPPSEAYYCVGSGDTLLWVGGVSNKPTNCSSVGAPTLTPGDYIQIQVTSTYSPKLPRLSVGSLLPTTMTASARMRLK